MNLIIKPASFLKGIVNLPGSKSYSIRAVFIAGLNGKSKINHPSDCDDVKTAVNVIKTLGSKIFYDKKNINYFINSQNFLNSKISKINVNESGTVLRFLIPLVSLKGNKIIIDGKGTLKGRPNTYLINTLRTMGVELQGKGKNESIPVKIESGRLKGGKIFIDGSLSSQFISALFITCPLLKENSEINLTGKKIVSKDYIEMTLQVLKRAGIKIEKINDRKFFIKGNQKYKGLKNFDTPSDYGLAAFFLAAASLINSDIAMKGFFKNDLVQADGRILDFLRKMGVKFYKSKTTLKIKGPFKLKGGSFSLKDCPDLVPIMSVLALFADRRTRLYDIEHARSKESDRISDLRMELLKTGANVIEKQNEIIIYPKKNYKTDCILDPHNDHRLAMSFSVLGAKLGVVVKDIECTSKSYPQFVRDLKKINAPVKTV